MLSLLRAPFNEHLKISLKKAVRKKRGHNEGVVKNDVTSTNMRMKKETWPQYKTSIVKTPRFRARLSRSLEGGF